MLGFFLPKYWGQGISGTFGVSFLSYKLLWCEFQVEPLEHRGVPPFLSFGQPFFLVRSTAGPLSGRKSRWGIGLILVCLAVRYAVQHFLGPGPTLPFHQRWPATRQKSWRRAQSSLLLACWKCRLVFFWRSISKTQLFDCPEIYLRSGSGYGHETCEQQPHFPRALDVPPDSWLCQLSQYWLHVPGAWAPVALPPQLLSSLRG